MNNLQYNDIVKITTCANYFCNLLFYLGFYNFQPKRLGYKVPSILDLWELAQVVKIVLIICCLYSFLSNSISIGAEENMNNLDVKIYS